MGSDRAPKQRKGRFSMAERHLNYVSGQWVEAESGETYPVINPTDGTKIAEVPKGGVEDARAAIDAARDAFDKGPWGRSTPGGRAGYLLKLADRLQANAGRFAGLGTTNPGERVKRAR